MNQTVFDVLREERLKIRSAPSPSGENPDALAVKARLLVLDTLLAREEAILRRGIGDIIYYVDIDVAGPPSKARLLDSHVERYLTNLSRRFVPADDGLQALMDRPPWYATQVRLNLYRRVRIERSGLLMLEGLKQKRTLSAFGFWERDCARLAVFTALCGSLGLAARQSFFKHVEHLRLNPVIAAEIKDKEAYRQAWLEAVAEVKNEILGIKEPAMIDPKSVDERSMQPRPLARASSASAHNQVISTDGEANKTGVTGGAGKENKGNSGGEAVEVVDFDTALATFREAPWTETVALLGDAREWKLISQLEALYGDIDELSPAIPGISDPDELKEVLDAFMSALEAMCDITKLLDDFRRPLIVQARYGIGKIAQLSDFSQRRKLVLEAEDYLRLTISLRLDLLDETADSCRETAKYLSSLSNRQLSPRHEGEYSGVDRRGWPVKFRALASVLTGKNARFRNFLCERTARINREDDQLQILSTAKASKSKRAGIGNIRKSKQRPLGRRALAKAAKRATTRKKRRARP